MNVTSAILISTQTARRSAFGLAFALATFAGGCSNDGGIGGLFSTGSITDTAPVVKAAADPVCVSLASQIETLRAEGAVERLEKAADGKTQNVSVQRTSLAKQAQLNKVNSDYIAKCGTVQPKMTVAAATVPTPVAKTVAKAAPAAAKETGVTVAAPAAVVAPAQ